MNKLDTGSIEASTYYYVFVSLDGAGMRYSLSPEAPEGFALLADIKESAIGCRQIEGFWK